MIDPEKKLWQSVIITAIKDALSLKDKKNSIYGKQIAHEAKEWLLNNNSNYFKVCSMADVNPLSLREKVKEAFVYENQVMQGISGNMTGINSVDIDSD